MRNQNSSDALKVSIVSLYIPFVVCVLLLSFIFPFFGSPLVLLAITFFVLIFIHTWCQKFEGKHKVVGSFGAVCSGIMLKFIALYFSTPKSLETIGESQIIRHASPALESQYEFDSYVLLMVVMFLVISFYWSRNSKGNES